VREVLARFGFHIDDEHRATGRGAWMLARSGGRRVVSMKKLERALNALPVELLPAARKYAD